MIYSLFLNQYLSYNNVRGVTELIFLFFFKIFIHFFIILTLNNGFTLKEE